MNKIKFVSMDDVPDIRGKFRRAYKVAEQSHDTGTHVGAVLDIPDSKKNHVVACNRFPAGLTVTRTLLDNREKKLDRMVHAEEGVILFSARSGLRTLGSTMYAPWASCAPCARKIIQAGVSKLYTHRTAHNHTPERWKRSIEEALAMLLEGGVKVYMVGGTVGDCTGLINGETFEP